MTYIYVYIYIYGHTPPLIRSILLLYIYVCICMDVCTISYLLVHVCSPLRTPDFGIPLWELGALFWVPGALSPPHL